jgi:chromosome segregation ATPase
VLYNALVFYFGNFIVFFVNQLEAELARLRDQQIVLQEKLTKDSEAIETFERLLTTCRQDTLSHKVANQTTLAEVNMLREKITALQDKL